LAIGGLSERRGVLRSHADRVFALLRHRSVINHQHSIAAADQLVSLHEQLCFKRRRIPDPSRNKMVQLIITTGGEALRHGRNALAIAWSNQPRDVKRAHPLSSLMT
jgi:hypothetical protein